MNIQEFDEGVNQAVTDWIAGLVPPSQAMADKLRELTTVAKAANLPDHLMTATYAHAALRIDKELEPILYTAMGMNPPGAAA